MDGPLSARVFFGASASDRGAVMYTASECGCLTAGPDGERGSNSNHCGARSAPKLPLQNHFPRSINPVDLKNVLRQIQPNHANLVHGRLPCLVESISPVWHIDAVGGRPPHHCEEPTGRANAPR